MGSRLTLGVPDDYVLRRDLCSYGYFRLWPNHWDAKEQVFWRVLDVPDGVTLLRVRQPKPKRGERLIIESDRTLTRESQRVVRAQLSRLLRLDETAEQIRTFHKADPRWKRAGYGRISRSPTLFEDVVKTVTSCNVQWPSTVMMNRRLCEVLGQPVRPKPAEGLPTHAFPTPAKMARSRATTLRGRCRTGYRDQRLIDLAKIFHKAEIDEAWMEDPATPDDAIHDTLLTLPGIGPYAAANIMQLLGRYNRLPLDSESVRHGREVLGYAGNERSVMKQVAAHFESFGEHSFRSYWLELWTQYESEHGPAWAWKPQGKSP